MIQQNLFRHSDETPSDPPPKPPRPTSHVARDSVAEDGPRVREMIWGFLDRQGEHGATDAEIQEALGIDGNTERPKRLELSRAGQIDDSGRVRCTPSGRDAIVWVTSRFFAGKAQKQHRLPLSPDRQRIERRAAEREQSHGPTLDALPAEELESYCLILPGWPRLFGRTWTADEARRDPVCRRLLLAAIADDPPASSPADVSTAPSEDSP